MSTALNADLVFARLQLRCPGARHLVVISSSPALSTESIAAALANAAMRTGQRAGLLRVGSRHHRDRSEPATVHVVEAETASVHHIELLESEAGDAMRIKRVLDAVDGVTVACAGDVRRDAIALRLVSVADAVLVAVKRGGTSRADLAEIRREVLSAGGTLVGAILTS